MYIPDNVIRNPSRRDFRALLTQYNQRALLHKSDVFVWSAELPRFHSQMAHILGIAPSECVGVMFEHRFRDRITIDFSSVEFVRGISVEDLTPEQVQSVQALTEGSDLRTCSGYPVILPHYPVCHVERVPYTGDFIVKHELPALTPHDFQNKNSNRT